MLRRLLVVAPLCALAAVAAPPAPFDPDADHVANRLHRHLWTRTAPDGKAYDQESLEVPFAPRSRFLTDGESHRRALALLDEFLKAQAARPIKDPLKRAVLQRDLWNVFAVTAGAARQEVVEEPEGRVVATVRFSDPGDDDLERRPQRRELQRRLARAMRSVALTAEEIGALPDNLADAVRSRTFPAEFDPRNPARPFLPPDLLAEDGPWVPIANPTREDGLAAPGHLAFTKGRSVFTVFLRLPDGRKAAEKYVKDVNDAERKGAPRLPPLPEGAQTALLRRMLLIDEQGRPHETRLTESLELRVYHKNDLGHPFAFHLRRSDLFTGRAGGLHAIGPDETTYFDFQVQPEGPSHDPIEATKPRRPEKLMSTCQGCHARTNGDGILSVATLHAGLRRQMGLTVTTPAEQVRATTTWLRRTYTWGLFQGMWEPATR
jgi:hypothetical protein